MQKKPTKTGKVRFYVWIDDYFEGCNYLIDANNKLIYGPEERKQSLGRDDDFYMRYPNCWRPIFNEESICKLLIGGWHYAKSTYENFPKSRLPC